MLKPWGNLYVKVLDGYSMLFGDWHGTISTGISWHLIGIATNAISNLVTMNKLHTVNTVKNYLSDSAILTSSLFYRLFYFCDSTTIKKGN